MADELSAAARLSGDEAAKQELTMLLMEDKLKLMKPMVDSSPPNGIWPTVKPFVNGGVAGFLNTSTAYLLFYILQPSVAVQRYKAVFRMPFVLPVDTIHASLQLGSYEILRRKVKAANKGMPPTLYQDACCGLASGAIVACFSTPVMLAYRCSQGSTDKKSLLQVLYHTATSEGVLALWKGGSRLTNLSIVSNMGMLASYSQSLNYIRESPCSNDPESVLGAGVVSSFFAAACTMPLSNVYRAMPVVQQDGKCYPNNSISTFLDCAHKLYKLGGPLAFFKGFPEMFISVTPNITGLWLCLELVKEFEDTFGSERRNLKQNSE